MTLEMQEECYALRRCFFEVQNEVGLGHQEEAYHQACRIHFAEQGLPAASRLPHSVLLGGEEVLALFPDFVAWDVICIELKAVPRKLSSSDLVQLFNYLKVRGARIGFLVNMGLDRVIIERVVYSPPPTQLVEDWGHWVGRIRGTDQEIGYAIRDALVSIYEDQTTGYGDEIFSQLLLFALKRRKLSVTANPVARAYFRRELVDEAPLSCLVVEGRILLTSSALFDTNEFNLQRGRSYLKSLGLTWGIAADFGKTEARITGFQRSPEC